CLAKTPADRFGTGTEFAASVRAWTEVAKPVTPPRKSRGLIFAAGALAIIALAFLAWRFGPSLLHGRPTDPGKKDWILVAEVDGPADDGSLAGAVRDLVSVAL